jgi:citrate synthase
MADLHWKTAITHIEPNKISIRGFPLDELMGRVSYAQMIYLLFKGELPDANAGKLVEAILVSSIDHGTTPPSTLSAITVASTGSALNAALAAGILAISEYHGGAIEECMHIMHATMKLINDENLSPSAAAQKIIATYRQQNKRLSGFGHRLHTADPRTRKLFQLAEEYGRATKYVHLAHILEAEMENNFGKKLPLNVDGAIATLLCELDFDPFLANAFFMIARVPGLIAHIYEEKTRYKPMRQIHPSDVEYDGPGDRTI